MLYSLTAGLDRVSLVEVLRELEASRNRMLDAAGGPCQVVQLLAEREKLRSEIEELGAVNHRYGRLAAERDQLHGEITRLEEEANRLERLARVTDLAAALRPRWTERAALDEQLSALGPPRVMPEQAIERLDALNARIGKHQQHSRKSCPTAGGTQAGVRRAGGQRCPVAPGRPDRGLQGAGALDRPVAGGDRRIGEGNRRAFVRIGRRMPAAGLRRRIRDCAAGVCRPKKLSTASLARANSCGRAAGDWKKRSKRRPPPSSRPSRFRGRSNPRWPRAAGTIWPPPWTRREISSRSSAAACKSTIASTNWPAIRRNWKSKAGSRPTANCCRWA